ncbi:MAG: hypothetical protein ACRERV_04145, partial [Methylococcales bacterium]
PEATDESRLTSLCEVSSETLNVRNPICSPGADLSLALERQAPGSSSLRGNFLGPNGHVSQ